MEKRHIILDTDISNEIDDQFALTYLIKSLKGISLDAITIAPFKSTPFVSTKTIMDSADLSYNTACKILDMLCAQKYKNIICKGAIQYFHESKQINPASQKMIELARKNEHTTIIAIGAITNVAVAIHSAPDIAKKIDIIWLGGHSFLSKDNNEFNFKQDIDAVRTAFNSKARLAVIPCKNVASQLSTTIFELEHYIGNLGEVGVYLCKIFKDMESKITKTKKDLIGRSITLWDMSAVAYFINKDWFSTQEISCPRIADDTSYVMTKHKHKIIFVNDLDRQKIFQDFFIKMGYKNEK